MVAWGSQTPGTAAANGGSAPAASSAQGITLWGHPVLGALSPGKGVVGRSSGLRRWWLRASTVRSEHLGSDSDPYSLAVWSWTCCSTSLCFSVFNSTTEIVGELTSLPRRGLVFVHSYM